MRLGDLDNLKEVVNDLFRTGEYDCNSVLKAIDSAPTVEAFTKEDMTGAYNEGYACGSRENTRPQGEWIPTGQTMGFSYVYACNKCGIYHKGKTNFCPNCGEKMKGGVV